MSSTSSPDCQVVIRVLCLQPCSRQRGLAQVNQTVIIYLTCTCTSLECPPYEAHRRPVNIEKYLLFLGCTCPMWRWTPLSPRRVQYKGRLGLCALHNFVQARYHTKRIKSTQCAHGVVATLNQRQ